VKNRRNLLKPLENADAVDLQKLEAIAFAGIFTGEEIFVFFWGGGTPTPFCLYASFQ